MKTFHSICIVLVVFVQQGLGLTVSTDAVAKRVRAAMLASENGEHIVSEEMAAATSEQRRTLVDAIDQIVVGSLKALPLRSADDDRLLGASLDVFQAVSDENAILQVFGSRLNQMGANSNCETWVMLALARCRDPRAVEIMTDYARYRLNEITPWLPNPPGDTTDKQKKALDDIAFSFLHAVEALAASENNSGKVVARNLRDEFAKMLAGSSYREDFLRHCESRIDPLLQRTAPPIDSHGHASNAASPLPSKKAQATKSERPTLTTSPADRFGRNLALTIVIVAVSLCFLGIIIWFLRRK